MLAEKDEIVTTENKSGKIVHCLSIGRAHVTS